jgi:RecB family exonuclease
VQKQLISKGYEVRPELDVTVRGSVAVLKGRIDIVAIKEDSNLIVEVKTGTPRASDKIQLMLYIWALPKSNNHRFRGVSFDGLLVYENHEIEISALEIDEDFLKHFSQFTADIMSSEPDRKYPSPRECKWCTVADCDEKINEAEEKSAEEDDKSFTYVPDFF